MKYSSKVLAVCFVAVLVMFYYSKTVFASTVTVDFDTAISGTGGDPADDFDSDTLADGDEFAVLSTLLADDTIDLSSGAATGQVQAGVAQADVYNAWIANQTQMSNDLAPLGNTGAAFVDPFAAFMTLADPATVTALVGVVGGYGITLDPGNYDLTQADFLSAAGDADGDGYGDANPPSGVAAGSDCDDSAAYTHPGAAGNESHSAACMKDADHDGYGDDSPPLGVTAGSDCDDSKRLVHPGAREFCNGIDDNCDGVVDGPGVCCGGQPC